MMLACSHQGCSDDNFGVPGSLLRSPAVFPRRTVRSLRGPALTPALYNANSRQVPVHGIAETPMRIGLSSARLGQSVPIGPCWRPLQGGITRAREFNVRPPPPATP